MKRNCKFCNFIAGKVKRPGGVIFKCKEVIAFMGTQHHKGHVIVATTRHVEDLLKLSHKEHEGFFECTLFMAKAVESALQPDKMNYAVLGNWVPHLHWHIYPRYKHQPDYGNPIDYSLPVTLSRKQITAIAQKIKKMIPHVRRD